MQRRGPFFFWLLLAVGSAAGGYVWWDNARTAAQEGLVDDGGVKPVAPIAPIPSKARLHLELTKGDEFPLVKTVTETIIQQTARGPIRSLTEVKVTLVIRVRDVQGDRKQLRVDYERVQYRQDVAGEKLEFDSDHPPRNIPLAVQPYQGLVKNGFDFWIGPDNKVQKIEDFDGFLKRCVAHIPERQRAAVMMRFFETTGDERVANFIDDSIGLLPYRKGAVKVGERWERPRRVGRPVPLYLTQTCTLIELTADFAEIGIVGEIVPSTIVGPSNQPAGGLQVIVKGGKTEGHCRIRRKTGLPENSRIDRTYDMVVRYPDGRSFKQTKSVRTVIRVFTQQGAPKTIRFASANTPTKPGTARVPAEKRRPSGKR